MKNKMSSKKKYQIFIKIFYFNLFSTKYQGGTIDRHSNKTVGQNLKPLSEP